MAGGRLGFGRRLLGSLVVVEDGLVIRCLGAGALQWGRLRQANRAGLQRRGNPLCEKQHRLFQLMPAHKLSAMFVGFRLDL